MFVFCLFFIEIPPLVQAAKRVAMNIEDQDAIRQWRSLQNNVSSKFILIAS